MSQRRSGPPRIAGLALDYMTNVELALPPEERPPAALGGNRLSRSGSRRLREQIIEFLLFLAAFSSVAITVAIVVILVSESVVLFRHV